MRTEQQLREALTTLADQPRDVDAVRDRILTRTSPSTVRRRRAMLVLAAAIVVVLALTLPSLLVQRSAVPADTRAPGNWNLIHHVDLPPGWEIEAQQVSPVWETTSIRPVGAGPGTESCAIDVSARGRNEPGAAANQRQPVEVNGRPGFYVGPPVDQLEASTGVFWSYADDAWARVDCARNGEPDRDQSLEIARRVVFAPTRMLLPFRLRSLPEGYAGSYVQEGRVEGSEVMSVGVALDATVPSDLRPQIGIMAVPGTAEVIPGVPGFETGTVRGYPAVFNAREGSLSLNVGNRTVRIGAEGGEPADLTRSLWAAGRRELLLDVAQRLTLADLDDRSTWFDANRALGG